MKKTLSLLALSLLVASTGWAQVKDPALVGVGDVADRGTFTLPGEDCTSNGGTNCSIALPDDDPVGVTSSFTFAGCTEIADLNVGLDVTHTWVGDLIVSVEGPSTTSTFLMDQPGSPLVNLTFGCDDNDVMAVLDDEGTGPVEDACAGVDATPGISGVLIPDDLLDAFDGEDADGMWTLSISDNAAGDTGMLNNWSLEVACAVAPPTATEVPTVGHWGLFAMFALLALVAVRVIRH